MFCRICTYSLPVNEKEIRNSELVVLDNAWGAKRVVQVHSVKKLGEAKFGGAAGLAKEKTKRAAKSEEKWLEKCEVAEAENKKLPPKPDMVKYEEQKDEPKWQNSICIFQRTISPNRVLAEYPNLNHSEESPAYLQQP